MRATSIVIFSCFLLSAGLCLAQSKQKSKKLKKTSYEEVDFEGMIQRYLGKEIGAHNALEGIYTVSCVITTRKKKFLSKNERIKVVERKDNYARVAVIKDWPSSSRDFIEVSLSFRDPSHYPIVGEISMLSEGRGMIYKHKEPDGKTMAFSMAHQPTDLIEGEYSFMDKRKIVTYKLSYLKIYPKANEFMVEK
jgi:hypothetical protein